MELRTLHSLHLTLKNANIRDRDFILKTMKRVQEPVEEEIASAKASY
jgi:hypothetical protein